MERCDTCAHWTDRPGWEQSKDGLKRCDAVKEKWVVEDRVAEAVRLNRYESDTTEEAYDKATAAILAEARAVVVDGSQYMAALLTRPDFGCVLWKQR